MALLELDVYEEKGSWALDLALRDLVLEGFGQVAKLAPHRCQAESRLVHQVRGGQEDVQCIWSLLPRDVLPETRRVEVNDTIFRVLLCCKKFPDLQRRRIRMVICAYKLMTQVRIRYKHLDRTMWPPMLIGFRALSLEGMRPNLISARRFHLRCTAICREQECQNQALYPLSSCHSCSLAVESNFAHTDDR